MLHLPGLGPCCSDVRYKTQAARKLQSNLQATKLLQSKGCISKAKVCCKPICLAHAMLLQTRGTPQAVMPWAHKA